MFKTCLLLAFALIVFLPQTLAYDEPDARSCTTVTAGRLATTDGSVITSHTCDSYDGKSWLQMVPAKQHAEGAECKIHMKTDHQAGPNDYGNTELNGSLPQVPETYGYLYGFYPIMNDHQLAISESTFHGKEEMQSDDGLLNCYELSRLIGERCTGAREAVLMAGQLLKEYGYNDFGETLNFCDPQEAWTMEIVGPGKGKKGAVWAARRIPDDEVHVNANMSRILEVDLTDPDVLASENLVSRAIELGFYDPKAGKPFRFAYAYAQRSSMAGRRREWRVYSLLCPSREFDPNGENFPFSIKPDAKISVADIMKINADTYEGTEFDMTKFMVVPDEDGKLVKSPYANPFMAYDEMYLWKINGGWNQKGERNLARSYCVYGFVSQCRENLPDAIGGLTWLFLDNPAMTCYAPFYCQQDRLPTSFGMGGGDQGRAAYSRDSAWWAFNRVSHLAAHRWGDIRADVAAVRDPLQTRSLEQQAAIEQKALNLYREDPKKAVEFLSNYSREFAEEMTAAYWKLGDDIWTKYDGRF